ncbi:MAG: ADP-ribosylglycohydrolase family protein [Desulfobulbaceae bacterium]|nr:ADP-ribosylglycohydrolase family protein [Desulfobulbaceae bacterium]
MNNNAAAMTLASFAGDSLALGAHWIYDTQLIDTQIGRMETLLPPLPGSYHPNRRQGEFTHYGDQTLVLLESLVKNDGFKLDGFAGDWQELMQGYDGYMDKASTAALENLQAGKSPQASGSASSDLGGAARIAPLIAWYANDLDSLVEAAQSQTKMTHRATATVAGAEFLAKTAFKILHGTTPTKAIEESLEEGMADLDLDNRIRMGLDSAGKNSREVIGHFGRMCGVAAAMPGVIHLVASYENDLKTALIENVMAGGDSAARGLACGMLLGAHLGMDAIPQDWLDGMRQQNHIANLLAQLPTT